jgi:hypothetical protein
MDTQRYPIGYELDYYDKKHEQWKPCKILKYYRASNSYLVLKSISRSKSCLRTREEQLGETQEAYCIRKELERGQNDKTTA